MDGNIYRRFELVPSGDPMQTHFHPGSVRHDLMDEMKVSQQFKMEENVL